MKNYFSIAIMEKKLGGISRNTAMKEINEGKLNACRRGKGMYFHGVSK